MDISLAYITCKNIVEAKNIASICIEEQLAACANILPNITSVFNWNNRISEQNECILILKHRSSKFNELKNKILKLHSYSCPCVMRIDVKELNDSYKDWLIQQTAD